MSKSKNLDKATYPQVLGVGKVDDTPLEREMYYGSPNGKKRDPLRDGFDYS